MVKIVDFFLSVFFKIKANLHLIIHTQFEFQEKLMKFNVIIFTWSYPK